VICLPERQDFYFTGFQMSNSPASSGSGVVQSFLRRSTTCGYENNAFQAFHLTQVDKQFDELQIHLLQSAGLQILRDEKAALSDQEEV
jgi:hypothetical protein